MFCHLSFFLSVFDSFVLLSGLKQAMIDLDFFLQRGRMKYHLVGCTLRNVWWCLTCGGFKRCDCKKRWFSQHLLEVVSFTFVCSV